MIRFLNIEFPSTAGATAEERYLAIPYPGKYRLVGAWLAPATTQAAGDGTNRADVTLATSDGAGGAFTVQSTMSGNGTAYTVGVSREFALGTAGIELSEGQQIRVAKVPAGTGGTIDGNVCLAVEKVN